MTAKVLFAASEALPFAKTGGLADVAQALPLALLRRGYDPRLLIPAYPGARERLQNVQPLAEIMVQGQKLGVCEGRLPEGLRVWLLEAPAWFERAGGLYTDADGNEYADNALRFGGFSQAIAVLAAGVADWRPDVVHLNDWHTGLAPIWLGRARERPATVFTIHNLAYQGRYWRPEYDRLGLPPELWHPQGVEFYGGFSFLKAGIVYADAVTTVSPGYAGEIQTPEFGEGMDGVIRSRSAVLLGITNGIDTTVWDPAHDPHLVQRYDIDAVAKGKRANKAALQAELGLMPAAEQPLIAFIGRLAHQKGTDLLLQAADWLDQQPAQFVLLGSGEPALERSFEAWARRAPGRVAVRLGYDEGLAHRIEAGADIFVMPSRYEPCGLNQMYSQRYGTVPVVRRTGGLADTVLDATPRALREGTATGVLFEHADVGGVVYGLQRALGLYRQTPYWRGLRRAGMRRDFGWNTAAILYGDLYDRLRARGGLQ